jgi:hypothetical protein
MDELTRLLRATQSATSALADFEQALIAFNKKVDLRGVLTAFEPKQTDAVDPDALDPCPTVDELKAILTKAAAQIGKDKVRDAVMDEANGRKVSEMNPRERQLVRLSLEMKGYKP